MPDTSSPGLGWRITVTVDTALCIGDSGSSDSLLDRTTVKNRAGELYIPASTLKGVWRHACEALAAGLGWCVCHGPRAENMCADRNNQCIVCRLFGSPASPSSIVVGDLEATMDTTESATRSGVTINRYLGTAQEKRLFFIETSQPNARVPFVGDVYFTRSLLPDELNLLRAGLHQIHAIGSGKSVGLGWVSIKEEELTESEQAARITPTKLPYTDVAVEIELRSPLAAGGRKPTGSATESTSYIRGGLLRGGFAQVCMKELSGSPGENEAFRKLFLNEEAAIFRNAYPASRCQQAAVLPATALSCKGNPGFLGASSRPPAHGVFDTLLERIVSEAVDWPYHPTCPCCKGRTEASSGFYSYRDGIYHSEKTSTQLLTRVAINRHRKAAEDELLYHIQAIDPVRMEKQEPDKEPEKKWVRFIGSACIPSSMVEEVSHQLQNGIRRIGGGGSRGLGEVRLKVREHKAQHPIEERIQRFNQALQKLWATYSDLPTVSAAMPEGTYFTIDLQADAILVADDGWQRSMVLNAQVIQAAAHCQAPVELVRSFASYDYLGGWNAAWKLPKETELVTRMGSVFVYRTTEMDAWYEPLKHLQTVGVGNRRQEGFGQVLVCESFHLRTRDQLATKEGECCE